MTAVSPGRSAWRRRLLHAAGAVAALACAAIALARVDLHALRDELATADPRFLLLAAAANVASLAAHGARLRAVVGARERVPFGAAFAGVAGGYAAGLALPARGGDLVRAHLVARRTGVSAATTLAATGLDYVVGTVTLAALLAVVLAASPLPPWAPRALAVLVAIGGAGALAARLLRARKDEPPPPGGRAGVLERFRAGLGAAHDARALAAAAAWGLAGWVAEALVALATLAAVGLPPTLETATVAVLAGSLGSVVAAAPANAGTFELAVAVAIGQAGAARAPALAFAVAYHVVHVVPVAVIGGAILIRHAQRGAATP